jgi:hypothetical protein
MEQWVVAMRLTITGGLLGLFCACFLGSLLKRGCMDYNLVFIHHLLDVFFLHLLLFLRRQGAHHLLTNLIKGLLSFRLDAIDLDDFPAFFGLERSFQDRPRWGLENGCIQIRGIAYDRDIGTRRDINIDLTALVLRGLVQGGCLGEFGKICVLFDFLDKRLSSRFLINQDVAYAGLLRIFERRFVGLVVGLQVHFREIYLGREQVAHELLGQDVTCQFIELLLDLWFFSQFFFQGLAIQNFLGQITLEELLFGLGLFELFEHLLLLLIELGRGHVGGHGRELTIDAVFQDGRQIRFGYFFRADLRHYFA